MTNPHLPLDPLQTAIYAKLIATVTWPVYDSEDVPADPDIPGDEYGVQRYVTLGDQTCVPWDTIGGQGFNVTQTLHVWVEGLDRPKGKKEVQSMMAQVTQPLTTTQLTLSGGFIAQIGQFESAEPVPETEPTASHGVVVIRFHIHRGG